MFDLGFDVEVEVDVEGSGAIDGRGVRRRAWRVRPLKAMRVGIIFGWYSRRLRLQDDSRRQLFDSADGRRMK